MKILLLHSNKIDIIARRKAIKTAEDIKKNFHQHMEECITVFASAEKGDEEYIKKISEEVVANVKKMAQQVKAKNVMLYPYVHLTSTPSSPDTANNLLNVIFNKLKKEFKNVDKAPFGWYKEFDIHVKGHPLAELSREIKFGDEKAVPLLKTDTSAKKESKKVVAYVEKKLPENDHRKISSKLELFSVHEELGPGLPLFHPKLGFVRYKIEEWLKKLLLEKGYDLVYTPHLYKAELWKKSGHYEKYKENMFFTQIDNQIYGIKPMNCPGHVYIYKSRARSYKDLPLRFAEFGTVYRNELSGNLSGLFRVRAATQDDAHIFCTESQMVSEIVNMINFVYEVYSTFNLDKEVKIEVSTKPEKYIGSDAIWDKATKALESALKNKKLKYKINKGDGAFYGPKIDFHIKDKLGRYWQLATIQADFNFPERFDLNYIGEDNKKHRPVMLHRTILGSMERFLGILIEHYEGRFPIWIAPTQAVIINMNEKLIHYAQKIAKELRKYNIRIKEDFRDETVQSRIRDAEIEKIPYILVVGERELKAKTLAVRKHGKKPEFGVKVGEFLKRILSEIEKKK